MKLTLMLVLVSLLWLAEAQRKRKRPKYRPTRPCKVGTTKLLSTRSGKLPKLRFCEMKWLLVDKIFDSEADTLEFLEANYPIFDRDGMSGITYREMSAVERSIIRPYRKKFGKALRLWQRSRPFSLRPLFKQIDGSDKDTAGFLTKNEATAYVLERAKLASCKKCKKKGEGVHDWILLAAFATYDTKHPDGYLQVDELKDALCNIQPLPGNEKYSRAVYYCELLTILSGAGPESKLSMRQQLLSIDPKLVRYAKGFSKVQALSQAKGATPGATQPNLVSQGLSALTNLFGKG